MPFILFSFFIISRCSRVSFGWGSGGWWRMALSNIWIYRILYRGVSMRNRMEYNGSAKRRLKLIVFPLSSHSDLLLFNSLYFIFFVGCFQRCWQCGAGNDFYFLEIVCPYPEQTIPWHISRLTSTIKIFLNWNQKHRRRRRRPCWHILMMLFVVVGRYTATARNQNNNKNRNVSRKACEVKKTHCDWAEGEELHG